MNLQEHIRRILREDKKTKSTNKEFSKYKDSKFNSLRDYTLQDIVDNWDSLSNHKNENIKTIKYFINNPDKITNLEYDEKGLEDGYHRLIAAKILKKPRFTYKMVENLQENIRKVLSETNTEKMISLVGQYINAIYPNFKDGLVKVEEYDMINGDFVEVYTDPDSDQVYARYFDRKRELELNAEIANSLDSMFNDDMQYVIEWFNNEFGTNAEYVTYIF